MAATNPERPGLTKVSMNRCEKLRWKGLFIEAEWDPTIQHSNDRSFWCQHTWNCLGPDGKGDKAVAKPCNVCSACKEIAAGMDVDVARVAFASRAAEPRLRVAVVVRCLDRGCGGRLRLRRCGARKRQTHGDKRADGDVFEH